MKLLIATPAYGGQVTTGYLVSLLETFALLREAGIDVEVYTIGTESLISRGRNSCAKYAIDGGFDKLLFIDADLIFSFENVKRLLESDKLIVGGTYPLKNFPITLNFNPLVEHRDLFGQARQQDNYLAWCAKYAQANGEAEVEHIPTGFMLIDMQVFARLSHSVQWYENFNADTRTRALYYDFFPVRVVDHQYESEDWAFCSLARAAGFSIWLQTRAVCGHIGTYSYGLGAHIVSGQPPLIP